MNNHMTSSSSQWHAASYDPATAQLLGMLTADGTWTGGRQHHYYSIGQNMHDKETYMYAYQRLMGTDLHITADGRGSIFKRNSMDERDLGELGFANNTTKPSRSISLDMLDQSCRRAWLVGMMDGDGCIYLGVDYRPKYAVVRHRITIDCCCEQQAIAISTVLGEDMGISHRMTSYHTPAGTQMWRVSISRRDDVKTYARWYLAITQRTGIYSMRSLLYCHTIVDYLERSGGEEYAYNGVTRLLSYYYKNNIRNIKREDLNEDLIRSITR